MTEQTKKQIQLLEYINVANIHADRLNRALYEIIAMMPLSADKLSLLSLDKLAYLDMMTMRFGKLQDLIGSKIFSLTLELLAEDAPSFIDKLHKLERLGYITHRSWWMELREIRNQVMHDYPDDQEAIALHLSTLTKKTQELLLFWESLKIKIAPLTKTH